MATTTLSSPSELLQRAWRRFTSRWSTAILVSIVMTFVMGILFMLGSGSILLTGPNLTLSAVMSVMLIWTVIAILLGSYSSSMMTVLMSEEKGISLGQVFSRANKVYWPVLVTGIVTGLIITGATILLVIPGLIMAVYLSLSLIVTVNEGEKGMAAAHRSRGILNGQWGQVLWRLVVLGFIIVLVNMIVTGLLRILSVGNPDSVASSLTSLVTSPLTVAYLFEIYRELKANQGSSKKSSLYNVLAGLGVAAIIGAAIFGFYFAREMNSAFSSEWSKALEDAGVVNYNGSYSTNSSWEWNWDTEANTN